MTPEGSLAFSRAPGLNWIDLLIGSCSSTTGISITMRDVDIPPTLGPYTVGADIDVVSANATISGEPWHAGRFWMRQYCGFRGGAGPPCPVEAGGGSMTITSASPARVVGSYRFTMVQSSTFSGPTDQRPPPVTRLVEGTFDLAFDDRRVCG